MENISAHPRLVNDVFGLLDRLEKDTDPVLAAGRGCDCILDPRRFTASELKRIERLALEGSA